MYEALTLHIITYYKSNFCDLLFITGVNATMRYYFQTNNFEHDSYFYVFLGNYDDLAVHIHYVIIEMLYNFTL